MSIRQAVLSDLEIVKHIAEITISEVYPHYYPKGAVGYFLRHHSEENILNDLRMKSVFLCLDIFRNIVGTVTVDVNEIRRLFVLPSCQGMGFGTEMLDFAEHMIFQQYPDIVLASSLPAKEIYLRRGYKETGFHTIITENDDRLCYDVMEKHL